jgi:integrase
MKEAQEQYLKTRIKRILTNTPSDSTRGHHSPFRYKMLSKKDLKELSNFDNYLIAKGRATETRYSHLYWIRTFLLTEDKSLDKVTKQDVINFLAKHEDLRTKEIIWIKLNNLFNFVERAEVTEDLRPESKKKRNIIKNVLSPKEIQKMIMVCDNLRDKAIISLLADAGLRCSEATAIRIRDLEEDEYGMKLHIFESKTGEGIVRLTNSVPDIKAWLNAFPVRDEHGDIPKDEFLLISFRNQHKGHKGKDFTDTGLRNMLRKIRERAGISKEIYPHIFRHSVGHRMVKEGYKPQDIQKHLRHSSITSTQIYFNYRYEDYEDALLEKKGLKSKDEKKLKADKSLEPRKCFHCSHVNPCHVQFCERCNGPITLKAIERTKARHTVRSIVAYEGISQSDREAMIHLVQKLIDKGILNREDLK